MCLAEPCCTVSSRPMRTLQLSFPPATEHRMHHDSAYTKISANSGVIRVDLCRRVDSQRSLTPYSSLLWQTSAGYMIQVPSSLPTWTTDTCGSNRSAYYRQSLSSQKPPHQSTLHYSPPRHKSGEAFCHDPIPPEVQDKIKLTLSCLGEHLQIHGDIEVSPVVLGEQASMEKTSQRFQKIATTLADLHAEGLTVAGSERPTHHVCWCMQVSTCCA